MASIKIASRTLKNHFFVCSNTFNHYYTPDPRFYSPSYGFVDSTNKNASLSIDNYPEEGLEEDSDLEWKFILPISKLLCDPVPLYLRFSSVTIFLRDYFYYYASQIQTAFIHLKTAFKDTYLSIYHNTENLVEPITTRQTWYYGLQLILNNFLECRKYYISGRHLPSALGFHLDRNSRLNGCEDFSESIFSLPALRKATSITFFLDFAQLRSFRDAFCPMVTVDDAMDWLHSSSGEKTKTLVLMRDSLSNNIAGNMPEMEELKKRIIEQFSNANEPHSFFVEYNYYIDKLHVESNGGTFNKSYRATNEVTGEELEIIDSTLDPEKYDSKQSIFYIRKKVE